MIDPDQFRSEEARAYARIVNTLDRLWDADEPDQAKIDALGEQADRLWLVMPLDDLAAFRPVAIERLKRLREGQQ